MSAAPEGTLRDRPHQGGYRPHKAILCLGDALLVAAGLALYVGTLAPTILPADSGEFQFVPFVLGIAHPPGYPLYTLLAKLFTLIPLGDVAYRVNLFSAVTSVLTLWTLSRAVRWATDSPLAGWVAAINLGVATTFWAQATSANIRSMTALLVAVELCTLLAYARTRAVGYLVFFSLSCGLGVTHHSSLVPLVAPLLAFLFLSDRTLLHRPSAWIKPALAFILSLSVLLYLPLRSRMGAPFDPAPIRSIGDFVEHVLALGFRGDMFYFVQPTVLVSRLRVLWNILNLQFSLSWLLLGVVGTVCLLLFHRRVLVLVGGAICLNSLLAVTYRAPQTVEYLIPTYLALSFISAFALWELTTRLGSRKQMAIVWGVALLLPLWTLGRNYPSFAQLSQDRHIRQYAESVLQEAPEGARVLANWHYATPLWYLQYVEHVRPDVEVSYVYPEGTEPIARTWMRRIKASVAERQTLVTNLYAEFRDTSYAFQPLGGAFWVQSGTLYQVPAAARRLESLLGDRIELIGFETGSEAITLADTVTVRVYWKPVVKLDHDYSVFVHLVDSSGTPLGQGDTSHAAARYEVGQVLLDEYHIPLLPTAKPGRYRLIAGVYFTPPQGGWQRLVTADGQDAVQLAEIEVAPLSTAPVTRHPLGAKTTSGLCLVGVDYDRSVPGQLRVYLHWRADGPADEGWTAYLLAGDVVVGAAALPVIPAGKYFSSACDLAAQAADLSVEVRSPGGDARSRWFVLGSVSLRTQLSLPAPENDARYIPLGDQMVLIAAEYPSTAEPGSPVDVRLSFVGARPITNDYTVSVSVFGPDGVFWAQHDGTPALGAIPTLKWIRGTRVTDEHTVLLPEQAAGSGTLRMTVYDAFTIQPLPILDERLARIGQGTQLELGTIRLR